MYTVWCTNEPELYIIRHGFRPLPNEQPPQHQRDPRSMGPNLPKLEARLDTLLMVLKTCYCRARSCTRALGLVYYLHPDRRGIRSPWRRRVRLVLYYGAAAAAAAAGGRSLGLRAAGGYLQGLGVGGRCCRPSI
ncbi:hypothetical protein F4778DRAFT_729735 [Xylariomycetidae sp. FL2044]|nr:hypothetical protein F4778DRAFT_729735 [Xylariomycetidae sp. FL2044]